MKKNLKESKISSVSKRQKGGPPSIFWSGWEIEGIIFDVDGTTTNSIEAYFEVFSEVSARFGVQIRKENVLEPMATRSLIGDRIIPDDLPGRNEKIKQFMGVIL